MVSSFKRRKIVRIIARLNIGGPAIHTIFLTKYLNNERYSSLLVAGSIEKGEGDMKYLASLHNVTPVFIKNMSREISIFRDIVSLKNIFSILCKEEPDIVHTHTAKAGTVGRLAAILYNLRGKILLKNRCKIIHTFHGHVFHSYFSGSKTYIFILIERFLSIFTDAIVTISERQREDIATRYKIAPHNKIAMIPLGFDLSPFIECSKHKRGFKKELKVDENTILIGIVGRLVPIKNHKLFIDAAKRLSGSVKDIKFVIIGDGEMKGELLSYVESMYIKEDIIFTGWRADLPYVYDGLDIVTLTSLNEGTPVSLIEAMASGKPVITVDVGGIRDIISIREDYIHNNEKGFLIGDNGVLVTPNNIDAFANGLKMLINNSEVRALLSKNGKAFVTERYSINRLVYDIETLYDKVLEG